MINMKAGDFTTLRRLLKKRYPDALEPVLNPIARRSANFAEAFGLIVARPGFVFGPNAYVIAKDLVDVLNGTTQSPQSTVDDLFKRTKEVTRHRNVGVFTELGSDTASPPSKLPTPPAEIRLSDAGPPEMNKIKISSPKHNVSREIHGIHIMKDSSIDIFKYCVRWMQTTSASLNSQEYQAIIKRMKVTRRDIPDSQSISTAGLNAIDAFSKHVYDLIYMKVEDLDYTIRDNHLFFFYNPDTDWYKSFHRLIRKTPLPRQFRAKGSGLDTMCELMQHIRREVVEESGDGKEVVFHLLIPSRYKISIKEPLHFPETLYPFRIEGARHNNKALVELNLPSAPAWLLHGIANVPDAKLLGKHSRNVPYRSHKGVPGNSTLFKQVMYDVDSGEPPRVLGSVQKMYVPGWRYDYFGI